MRVFVTGDRSMPLEVALPVAAITMLRLVDENTSTQFVTGNLPGVELAVNLVAVEARLTLLQQFAYGMDADDRPDFKELYGRVGQLDKIVVVHGDLMSSRIYRNLVDCGMEHLVEVVSPQLMFV